MSDDKSKLTLVNTNGVEGRVRGGACLPGAGGQGVSCPRTASLFPSKSPAGRLAKFKALALWNCRRLGAVTLDVSHPKDAEQPASLVSNGQEPRTETDHYTITWQKGTWAIDILHKATDHKVTYRGFTGPKPSRMSTAAFTLL